MAKEEAEKLASLEEDRKQRMKGVTTTDAAKDNHKSADDLDDG